MTLKLDWATYEAAKYACSNWHYSRCLPIGKLIKIGVWEHNKFIGVVIFSRGANKDLGTPFGLSQTECCELTRIALTKHDNPVSKILSIALKVLLTAVDMKCVVSFADPEQGHHGGIYQATNWIYTGTTQGADEYLYNGRRWHGRAFRKSMGSHLKYIDKGLQIIKGSIKHRYVMPLCDTIKPHILTMKQTYPKRVTKAIFDDQLKSGGAVPTNTLQDC